VPQGSRTTAADITGRRGGVLSSRAAGFLALAAPTALAAGLSFYDLGTRSIWVDESASIAISSQHGGALSAALAHDGGNMLAYYAVLHVLIRAFGNGIVVLRAPSAIAAAFTVALVSLLAKRLFTTAVAAAAGVLSAVSLPLVFWGQDARAYALMTALVAASFLAFVHLVDRDPAQPPSKWAFACYVVATTLAMYMGFIAILVVPAQLLSLVCHRRRWRPVALALAISALLCIPLAVLAAGRGAAQLFWVPKPDLSGLAQVVEELTSSGLQPQFPLTATSFVLMVLSLAMLVVALGASVRALRRNDEKGRGFALVLLVGWLVVPFLLALVESELGQSVFVARNLLISLPPAGILLALVALGMPSAQHSSDAKNKPWRAGPVLVAVLVALRALQLAPSYGTSPENWHSAVSYVLARSEPGDCIAFYPSDGRMAFEYYIGQDSRAVSSAPRPVLPTEAFGKVTPYVEDYASLSPTAVSQLAAGCSRIFLVVSHEGSANGPPESVTHFNRYLKLRAALEARYAAHSTASFGYADPVDVELLAR
jgi:mannosyltransferase